MKQTWDSVIAIIDEMLSNLPRQTTHLNERHLHHYFSHAMQSERLILAPTMDATFHPEWPTYKESAGIRYGKYIKVKEHYMPTTNGKQGGFLDFAIGGYEAPEIAIEFKLLASWKGEPVAFDFLKLLDRRNPFKRVVQQTVVLRPKGVSQAGSKASFKRAIEATYEKASERLADDFDNARQRHFVITELGNDVRHWRLVNDGKFVES
ncbi:hypothetical protein LOC68_13285 [Blastopirellula sp. JC732]|uniref:Uncharacterized protein n=1 Tax=Blastopirellula sediminis TaxID=2894196 RepID=A0A9X1SK44_9BACT|nr:hypothetical protein [Blastopirellula sediminis]MCC9607338.1 hypothetical protein [Blastopirellula sediminis]MCC9629369.1 hypothetical protein [Blastopirellula sediminis]